MPLSIPSRKSVVQSVRAYFLTAVPEWDTSTERRSFIGGLVKSLGSALHDWYVALRQATLQFFPQTAQGGFLTGGWWAAITKLTPLPAAPARGVVVITGVAGSVVAKDTELVANGNAYVVDHDVSIVQQSIAAISLTRSGDIVTFQSSGPHNLATGQVVVISGATESDYNGTVDIVVTAADKFTYAIDTAPTSPASGSPLVTATFANAEVTCEATGPGTNLDSGATLQVESTAGVDSTARVTFGGLGGGANVEALESYRERVLFALGSDFGAFTGDEIEIVTRQVPGVTRVWVRKADIDPPEGWPYEGQVFVAFMRDDEVNPFPSAQEVDEVKQRILKNCMTANTAEEDVVVASPTPQPVNFAFISLAPDSPSMRASVTANLQQFFREGVDYGVDVPEDDYRCAIRDTFDPQTRTRLKGFVLSEPAGPIDVAAANLPTLGTVTF